MTQNIDSDGEAASDLTEGDLIAFGRATIGAMHGEAGLSYVDRLSAASPEMAGLLVGHVYGSIYGRPELDMRSRQIATIAALTVLGDTAHELEIHIASALRSGMTRQEILEILLQMTAYAGFPRALGALKSAQAAFAKMPEPLA